MRLPGKIAIQEAVPMCHTNDNNYWCHGWVNKTKFKGKLLSSYLEGEEEPSQIFAGSVHHGWLITVAGDTSGCGWDTTLYFLDEPLPEGATHYGEVYDYGTGDEVEAEIVDGPHEVTWWEQ